MILAIRISGQVNLTEKVKESLHRLRIRRKFSAVLLKPTPQNIKILKRIRNLIAYGDIDNTTLTKLIESRAVLKDKKKELDVKSIVSQIEKTVPEKWDIKPFFRLHPPIGGIDSKKHFGVSRKAVLGDNKKAINDLIRRML